MKEITHSSTKAKVGTTANMTLTIRKQHNQRTQWDQGYTPGWTGVTGTTAPQGAVRDTRETRGGRDTMAPQGAVMDTQRGKDTREISQGLKDPQGGGAMANQGYLDLERGGQGVTKGFMVIQVTRVSQVVTGCRGGMDIPELTKGITGPLEGGRRQEGTQGVTDTQGTRDSQVVTGRRGDMDIQGVTQGLTGPLEAEDRDIQGALDLQGRAQGARDHRGAKDKEIREDRDHQGVHREDRDHKGALGGTWV